MQNKRLVMIFLLCASVGLHAIDWKGIGASIESFPMFNASFYKGLGRSFGAPPTGYDYTFSVYNDVQVPIYVGIQEIVSIMGGSFPKADGWSLVTVSPFSHYTVLNKEYYFEMFIKSTPKDYSNHMPYLPHADILYRQDAIQLGLPHSTNHHYFRSYIGKSLQGGQWVHGLRAEYLGFANPAAKGAKANKGLSLSSNLGAITIKNSTDQDFYVGYTNQVNATTMVARSAQLFALVAHDSFALYQAPSQTSLRPGTIGLFDSKTHSLLMTYSLTNQGFDGKSYTLEIYQNGASIKLGMQGLMPGNYDVPVGRVRDITPIKSIFWYQSAKGQKGLIDLPGKVWVVSKGVDNQSIIVPCIAGEAVVYSVNRPEIDQQLWVYFIYVATLDDIKAQQFIKDFLSGKIGVDIVTKYQHQAALQIDRARAYANSAHAISAGKQQAVKASEASLLQAIDGALDMHQGSIEDTAAGVQGYLVGGDMFLSRGVGAVDMHYVLAPSWTNSQNLPTAAVQNWYASTLSSVAPQGMPVPKSMLAANSIAVAAVPIPKAAGFATRASNWIKSKLPSKAVAKATTVSIKPLIATKPAAAK